jgi:alginate O-acetyltransferase complex protein AlgI
LAFTGYYLLGSEFISFGGLLLFYFSYNPWFLLLLIGTSGFDYFCARQISNGNYKKLFVGLSVVTNIGVLFAFKYFVPIANYFIDEFSRAECDYDSSYLLTTIIIPAGLSFYTFQSLSYTIDVYRGKYKAADKFYEFLLYVSFFHTW